MSANDDNLSGRHAERDWLTYAPDANNPGLGLCLGAQLTVLVLGGLVAPDPHGQDEITVL